jgi:creatinine amidohydrolase/Fe(II)-dependent formamide hydrolase-like protein
LVIESISNVNSAQQEDIYEQYKATGAAMITYYHRFTNPRYLKAAQKELDLFGLLCNTKLAEKAKSDKVYKEAVNTLINDCETFVTASTPLYMDDCENLRNESRRLIKEYTRLMDALGLLSKDVK